MSSNRRIYPIFKEAFDRISAFVFLFLVLPLFILVAILIKVESRGSVFYKQFRVGRNEKLFQIWKFRTMVQNADKTGPSLTQHEDSRITGVGKFLRRFSLDELPQLYNVLKGEMSLIGPRPEIPEIVKTYSRQQLKALHVKPGMTGLSQINGRDDLPIDIKLDYEIRYVENFSLFLDIKILFKTIPALINAQGNRF